MRRGDRRSSSDDNERNHPRPRRPEPMSAEESKKLLMTLRAQKQALEDQPGFLTNLIKNPFLQWI
jgi:hypothetical protein